MLKVNVLTREQPGATFLINRVQDIVPVEKVIYESWDGPPTPDTRGRLETLRGNAAMYQKYYSKRIRQELSGSRELELAARDAVFGHRWSAIERTTPVVEFYDRDWDRAKAELEKDPPDLLLVLGTGLIPDRVISVAKLACINIHTGLSPHYRGQNCTQFCILNEDFENIGVTVHLVRKAIDGGEILAQGRPDLRTGDNEFVINYKNVRVGVELYCAIIEVLLAGGRLEPISQPKDVGLLLMNRALTQGHTALVRKLMKEGALERYLSRASRNKIRPKPILESLQIGGIGKTDQGTR